MWAQETSYGGRRRALGAPGKERQGCSAEADRKGTGVLPRGRTHTFYFLNEGCYSYPGTLSSIEMDSVVLVLPGTHQEIVGPALEYYTGRLKSSS